MDPTALIPVPIALACLFAAWRASTATSVRQAFKIGALNGAIWAAPIAGMLLGAWMVMTNGFYVYVLSQMLWCAVFTSPITIPASAFGGAIAGALSVWGRQRILGR